MNPVISDRVYQYGRYEAQVTNVEDRQMAVLALRSELADLTKEKSTYATVHMLAYNPDRYLVILTGLYCDVEGA